MYGIVNRVAGGHHSKNVAPQSKAAVYVPVEAPRRRAHDDLFRIDARRVFGWLRRGLLLIVTTALVFGALGLSCSILTKPRFVAQAAILIDPSNLQVVPDDIYAQSQQRDSQLLEVESMVGVLTSGNTLNRVVTKLGLGNDAEFVKAESFLGIGFPLGATSSESTRPGSEVALEALASRIKAKREDGSFIVNLSLWTQDPQKSAQVVSALIDAFQGELAQQEADGAGRTAKALSDRLTTLKQDVAVAEDAAEAFKRNHNLQSTNGELISGQALTQQNTQVLDAQNRLIAAQSHYAQLTKGGLSGDSTDALQSATLIALRTQYSTLKQQYDTAALTLGPRHPRLRELQPQVSALQQQIAAEINRTIAAGEAAVSAAQSDLDALNAKITAARTVVATDNQAQVQLRQLQREADSSAAIYQAYLSRAGQVGQREQINTTNVRVISPPVPPTKRNWPPSPALAGLGGLLAGLLVGALLAAGFGLLRDFKNIKAAAAVSWR